MTATTRNILVGLAAVVVIGGGIYYYQKQKVEKVTENTITTTEEKTPEDVIVNPKTGSQNVATASVGDSLDEQRFNNTMTNARNAIGQKDYKAAIKQYQLALKYQPKADTAYIGLYVAYGAQGSWIEARNALDKAIDLAPSNADYWKWKITLLDEKTDSSYETLVSLYDDGMTKVNPAYKVNLVTHFARVAEYNYKINDAIAQWELAKRIEPTNATIYQSEIDRLKEML